MFKISIRIRNQVFITVSILRIPLKFLEAYVRVMTIKDLCLVLFGILFSVVTISVSCIFQFRAGLCSKFT